tara:strand:- start:955 stop:2046 length:1092 start_codon:yes stop_codon:yes gene_type:complete
MIPKILIIGSTGKLGSKLLKFSLKNNIKIDAICCFNNQKKIISQSQKFKIKNKFVLSKFNDEKRLFEYLKLKKINIVYFLDYGSQSIKYLNHFLNYQSKSIIAIANKELIIAGGKILMSIISKKKCTFIPLDSEHFSLFNLNLIDSQVKKISITASGGPFYFNKNINFNNVSFLDVLSHPKWSMGNNNLIDSSNFINKILEIFELSYIYNINLNKIDFVVSPEAFIHSIIHFNDNTISFNCFNNDMLITLIKPLSFFYKLNYKNKYKLFYNHNSYYFEKFSDSRFEIIKKLKKILNFSHYELIQFMLLNNLAQKKYLSGKIKYLDIVPFILKRIEFGSKKYKLNNLNEIEKILKILINKYEQF